MSYLVKVILFMLAFGIGWILQIQCTVSNPAYCNSNQDCTDPNFPMCDLSIHGCVGNQAGDSGVDQQPDSEDRPSDPGLIPEELIGDTLYVDDDTCPQEGTGTQKDPFCRITQALQTANPSQRIIRIQSGTYQENLQINQDVDLTGDHGTIIQTVSCPGIHISTGASVTLEKLVITGAGGIQVTGNASATIIDCEIASTNCIGIFCENSTCQLARNQIRRNSQGGIKLIGSAFKLENNMIVKNGSNGEFGGVWIDTPQNGSSLINNTIAKNDTASESRGGVLCIATFQILNSILWDNSERDVSELCLVDFSNISQEPGNVTGSNNLFTDPQFVNTDADNFHIQSTSPCVDQGSALQAPPDDIDGQTRPMGLGVDMGADEVR